MHKNMRIILILALIWIHPMRAEPLAEEKSDIEWKEKVRKEWQEYAGENCPIGATEEEVENKMARRYIAKIRNPFNSGFGYTMIYRVDDVTELEFDFDENNKLTRPATALGIRIWVRNSYNGDALWILKNK